MKPHNSLSPVFLRYIAALNGFVPKRAGQDFTYAEIGCRQPDLLTCLAASNPEGRFYGFVGDENARRAAEDKATGQGTFNVVFMVGSPLEIQSRLAKGSSLPPPLDFLCCDETAAALSAAERAALFDLAGQRLNPGGHFAYRYHAYREHGDALAFLVRECAAEMNLDQQQEFLIELKHLGALYLSRHPDLADKLDRAIAAARPQDFFALFADHAVKSGAFDMLVAMAPRGLCYGGSTNITDNFVELALPRQAQDIVVKCRGNYLYEPIKDYALDRMIRSDIWVKTPAARSQQPAQLFGGFAYGIVMPKEQIPATYAAQGTTLDLSSPLQAKLIDIMTVMPMGIGDFLSHPHGRSEAPEKILSALRILVACGVALPMRGNLTARNNAGMAQPRLVGNFNRALDKAAIAGDEILFASQALGCGVTVPARDAFVMQALNRGGMADSVTALMPELRRIAETPMAARLFNDAAPTPELAQKMVRDAVRQSLPQWYAYALLEAA